eukprot:1283409-Rhodomonas_salina.2
MPGGRGSRPGRMPVMRGRRPCESTALPTPIWSSCTCEYGHCAARKAARQPKGSRGWVEAVGERGSRPEQHGQDGAEERKRRQSLEDQRRGLNERRG